MIRCGYIRWEMHVEDRPCEQDRAAREAVFLAKPTYRNLDVLYSNDDDVRRQFAQGMVNYEAVLNYKGEAPLRTRIVLPDVGPRVYRYNREDREKRFFYWIDKTKRAMEAFAYEVVGASCRFPQLLIAKPVLRSNYAYMISRELYKVAQGLSKPQPTNETETPEIDTQTRAADQPIPELVAAELVRDVVTEEHFAEFKVHNQITVQQGERTYVIPRLTHGLIQVLKDGKPECRLCVVFKDPGMPPSDEVVMKYLLATQNPDLLWQVANRF
jgi:hypothetical protein